MNNKLNLAFTVPFEEIGIHPEESEIKVILTNVGNTNQTDTQHTDQINQTNHQKESLKDSEKNSTTLKESHQETSFNERGMQVSSMKDLPPTSQNASKSSIMLNHTHQNMMKRPVEETTPINAVTEIQKPNDFIGEQKNLNQCCVTPPDEEDVTTVKTEQQKNINSSVNNTVLENASSTTSKSVTITTGDVISSKITPDSKDVNNDTKKADNDVIDKLKPTMYETVSPELINATTETSMISKSSEITNVSSEITTVSSEKDQVKVENSTLMLEKEKEVEHDGLSLKSEESISENSSGSMPPGIIALIITITFAVAIIIGYIGMIIWKQYLERKYGRRELLVNELEFDTNDLRHFEVLSDFGEARMVYLLMTLTRQRVNISCEY
ncbi:cell wall integrity and stress response component 2-like [Vespula squamosa]|uniref:Cell wall integrity and stress response component 2-like n=1 Tax=Vespula squamosa TaxID=30214 RepID=A0ABD2A9G0_VESSQ